MAPEKTITIVQYTCVRCGYAWIPRPHSKLRKFPAGRPVVCPKCHRADWYGTETK